MTPKFFTPHEVATASLLADLIIPRDERSGSATDAGVVEFMAGDNLASLGHSNAWGLTEMGSIAVPARHSVSLIHEAFHLHDNGNAHCNWSDPTRIAVFEKYNVAGSFDDQCKHVHCTSTRLWTDTNGQQYGNTYICTPL